MPDKKEKKKDEKPPKDKDEDEEDEEDKKKKKESSDQANGDEKEESEDFKKDKNPKTEKNEKESNMIQIDKSVLEDFSKQLSDLKKENATRQKKTDNIEREKIIGDFSDKTQVYKIKSDFLKTADLPTMKVLESALQPVNEDINAKNQLFSEDFNISADDLQGKLENMYGVVKK